MKERDEGVVKSVVNGSKTKRRGSREAERGD